MGVGGEWRGEGGVGYGDWGVGKLAHTLRALTNWKQKGAFNMK